MQFSKCLGDVRGQVEADDAGKWDALAPCRDVTLHRGRLTFPEASQQGFEGGLSLSPWAWEQACQKLGLPTPYLRRCPPDLQDQNFNYWNLSRQVGRRFEEEAADPDESWLLRCKGANVRGVLSSRYARLDNAALLDALLPLVSGSRSRFGVGLAQLAPESFHLRLVDPTLARDVVPGDRLLVGVHVANSEVGLRAVTVDALVFRLVCSNGLIRRVNSKSLLRQRHVHVSEPRFAAMLESALGEAMTVAAGFIEQMALAVNTPVPHPESAIAILAEAWGLSRGVSEMVTFALLGESRPDSLFGLVNAVTQVAQRLPVEERVRLETLAGGLLDAANPSPADRRLRARVLLPRPEAA